VEAYLGGSVTAIERSAGTGVLPTATEALADAVPGLGATREAALLDAFGSVEGVRSAEYDELVKVPGIGPGMAARIQSSLQTDLISNGRT
jgi:excinuclease ABC subunit C